MRHRLRQILAVGSALLVLMAAGCAHDAVAQSPASSQSPAPSRSPADRDGEILVQVLRRYLSNPSDNSFPDRKFPKIFVLDHTVPQAADAMAAPGTGTPIPAGTQRLIVGALADLGPVTFVADRTSVTVNEDSCPEVKDGGILMTVGPAASAGDRVEVGVNGFVACLGATWLTYVVEYTSGTGWRVTGTTGSIGIA